MSKDQANKLLKRLQRALLVLQKDWEFLLGVHAGPGKQSGRTPPKAFFCDEHRRELEPKRLRELVLKTIWTVGPNRELYEDRLGAPDRFIVGYRWPIQIGEHRGESCFTSLVLAGDDPSQPGNLVLYTAYPATDEDVRQLTALT